MVNETNETQSGTIPNEARQQGLQRKPLHLRYVEYLRKMAKEHPLSAIGAMITIGGIIVVLLTTMSITLIGSVFAMSNTMHEIKAQQAQVLQNQAAAYREQIDDAKVIRTYEASNLARTNFMVGLMTPTQQEAINSYDSSHPNPIPEVHPNKKLLMPREDDNQ